MDGLHPHLRMLPTMCINFILKYIEKYFNMQYLVKFDKADLCRNLLTLANFIKLKPFLFNTLVENKQNSNSNIREL